MSENEIGGSITRSTVSFLISSREMVLSPPISGSSKTENEEDEKKKKKKNQRKLREEWRNSLNEEVLVLLPRKPNEEWISPSPTMPSFIPILTTPLPPSPPLVGSITLPLIYHPGMKLILETIFWNTFFKQNIF